MFENLGFEALKKGKKIIGFAKLSNFIWVRFVRVIFYCNRLTFDKMHSTCNWVDLRWV